MLQPCLRTATTPAGNQTPRDMLDEEVGPAIAFMISKVVYAFGSRNFDNMDDGQKLGWRISRSKVRAMEIVGFEHEE